MPAGETYRVRTNGWQGSLDLFWSSEHGVLLEGWALEPYLLQLAQELSEYSWMANFSATAPAG